jgi:hypothetical protein
VCGRLINGFSEALQFRLQQEFLKGIKFCYVLIYGKYKGTKICGKYQMDHRLWNE